MPLFDAHLDLGLNAMDWNRDLRLSARAIREDEAGMTDLKGRGPGATLSATTKTGRFPPRARTCSQRWIAWA